MDGQPDAPQPTAAERKPILVHKTARGWQVDYGSYAQGYHASREEAVEEATRAAQREGRALRVGPGGPAAPDERGRLPDEQEPAGGSR